jgi:radical SAM superfamily enzyme YgiQ (UPF0313 family)
MFLLINSPLFKIAEENYDEDSLPPIGLGYIATNLQKSDIECELIDCISENISSKEIINIINNKKPKFIGLNIFTTNMELVKEIIESIKFKTNIFIGGQAVLSLQEYIKNFSTKNQIIMIIGDADFIVSDIVLNKNKEDPIYCDNNRTIYKVDKNSYYYPNDISNIPLTRDFFKNEPIFHKKYNFYEAYLINSRGCIYNCAFCGAAKSLNKHLTIRTKTKNSIIQEIDSLVKKYDKLDSIRILDDLFLKDNKTISEAIEIFNNFNLKWRSMAHTLSFNKASIDDLKKLKNSGCFELFIGIESGSEKILKSIHKFSNIEIIQKNIKKLFEVGINIKAYFILGFPKETKEDFELTYQLANYLKNESIRCGVSFRISVFQFRPYHGTELYYDLFGQKLSEINTKTNDTLNQKIGRLQFNFTSGNYSEEDDKILFEYIEKINKLNKEK